MKVSLRRQQYRLQVRAEILQAARELFVREGYESFSMRKLAEKIGYSHANLYVHFHNKEQIFDCLVEESFGQLYERLQQLEVSDSTSDPVWLLKKAARVYVDFGLTNPGAYEFAFIIRRTDAVRPWNPHPALLFLRSVVERCIKGRRFRELDVDTTCQALWAAVHGVTALLILRPSFPWVEKDRLIQQVIDSAVDGLAKVSRAKHRTGAKHGK